METESQQSSLGQATARALSAQLLTDLLQVVELLFELRNKLLAVRLQLLGLVLQLRGPGSVLGTYTNKHTSYTYNN